MSARRIKTKAAPTRRLSSEAVRARLGTDAAGEVRETGSPLDFAAVREEVFRRLRSTGGRPGLEGVERKKIPVVESDWKMMESLAAQIAERGFRPSPGQVASVLISRVLRSVDRSSLKKIARQELKKEDGVTSHS